MKYSLVLLAAAALPLGACTSYGGVGGVAGDDQGLDGAVVQPVGGLVAVAVGGQQQVVGDVGRRRGRSRQREGQHGCRGTQHGQVGGPGGR